MTKWISFLKNQNKKTKDVLKNTTGAFLVKGAALVVSLMATPAYIRFFSDQEILGIWFTILSVLTWILNFDLGIGNGLRNKLTVALTENDDDAIKAYISSAYWMIGLIVFVITVGGLFLIPYIDWNAFFNIESTIISTQDLGIAVRYAFISIMLQFFLRLISSVLYALQKAAINNLISLVTSILLLLFAWAAPSGTPLQSLKLFSVAHIVCANLPLLIATILVFTGKLKKYKPRIKYFNKKATKEVLSLGGIFFVCQILYMVIANTNEFFVTRYTNPANVVDYQIYYKIFSLPSILYMLALTPVWSAVSKAVAEKDQQWLQRINSSILKISLLAIVGEFCIIPIFPVVLNVWLGTEAIAVNFFYAFAFALFGATMIFQSGVSTLACGVGKMKLQAACYMLGVIAKFIIIDVGIKLTGEWIIVVLANAIILIPYCILQQLALNESFSNRTR